MKTTWTDEYSIGWHDTDATGKLSPVTICKFLMETASHHAENSGFGYDAAIRQQQLWVIVRLIVKMNRYPAWGETIFIETWASGLKGLYAFRDYHILNEKKEVIGETVSTWMVINIKTRRPQEVGIVKKYLHLIDQNKVLGYIPEKIEDPQDPVEIYTHQVRYSDIDFHQHVNNNKYIEWAINALPYEKINRYRIESFTINFMSEAVIEDQISVEYSYSDEIVQGIRQKDSRPVFRIQFNFKEK